MATVVNMPRLSDTMEEGVVAQWLKKVGDKIEEGDILAEIETDKATMEFESFHEGVLLHIGVQEGETSPVDKLLAIIGEEDEDISGLLSGGNSSEEKEEEKTVTSEEIKEDTSSDNSSSEATVIPDGVQVITMPRLSDTMTDGTVASWLKKEGDSVEEGDILAEIETDKATMEFECFYEGTILYIGVQEGETAPVDSLLTIIGPAGTNVSPIIAGGLATEDLKFTDYAINKHQSNFTNGKKTVVTKIVNSGIKGLKISQSITTKRKYFIQQYWYNGMAYWWTVGEFRPGVYGVNECRNEVNEIMKSHCNSEGLWTRNPKITKRHKNERVKKAEILNR